MVRERVTNPWPVISIMEDSAELVTQMKRILLGAAVVLGTIPILAAILGFIYQRSHSLPVAVTSLLDTATSEYAKQRGRTEVLQHLCLDSTMAILTAVVIGFGLLGRLWDICWKTMPKANEYLHSLSFLACFFFCIALPPVVVGIITGASSQDFPTQLMSLLTSNTTSVAIALLSLLVMKKHGFRVFFPLLVASLILKMIYNDMSLVLTLKGISSGLNAPSQQAIHKMMVDHGANPNNAMVWNISGSKEDMGVRSGSFFGTFLILFAEQSLKLPENSQLAITAFGLAGAKYCFRTVSLVHDFGKEVGFWLVAFRAVLPYQAIFAAFGFPDQSIAGSIAITHVLSSMAKPVGRLLSNWLSRFLVGKADAHVVSLGYGQAWIQHLLRWDFTRYDQDPLYSLLYYSVPTAKDRISRIEQLMGKS